MKKILFSILCLFLLTFDVKAEVINPEAVTDFLNRIFGQQTTINGQQPILTILDENLDQQSMVNSQWSIANSHCSTNISLSVS